MFEDNTSDDRISLLIHKQNQKICLESCILRQSFNMI